MFLLVWCVKEWEKAKKKAGIFEELFHVMAAASRLLPAASSNQPTTKLFQNENATKVNIFSNLERKVLNF